MKGPSASLVSLATLYETCMKSEQLQRAGSQKQTGNEQVSSEIALHGACNHATNLMILGTEPSSNSLTWKPTFHLANIVQACFSDCEIPEDLFGNAGLKLS